MGGTSASSLTLATRRTRVPLSKRMPVARTIVCPGPTARAATRFSLLLRANAGEYVAGRASPAPLSRARLRLLMLSSDQVLRAAPPGVSRTPRLARDRSRPAASHLPRPSAASDDSSDALQ